MFRKAASGGPRARQISISIDHRDVVAQEGEPLAAVLLRTEPFVARHTAISGTPRAPFCMMGACFECLVHVDGTTSVRSCLVPVKDGMSVERPLGRPDPATGQLR